jgi:hypothetical protein
MMIQTLIAGIPKSRVRIGAAWLALGALLLGACAQSESTVAPYEEDTAGTTSSMAGTGGATGAGAGSGGGSAGTFTAAGGTPGVAGSSAGSPSTAGSAGTAGTGGSGGSAGTAGTAGTGGCAGAGGAASCNDQCPEDPDKTEPGQCGCGVSDVACQSLIDALVHRYSFDGTGTMISDLVGTSHGTVINGTVSGNGLLTLTTTVATNDYGELPDGILGGLTQSTPSASATRPAARPRFSSMRP